MSKSEKLTRTQKIISWVVPIGITSMICIVILIVTGEIK